MLLDVVRVTVTTYSSTDSVYSRFCADGVTWKVLGDYLEARGNHVSGKF